MELPKCGNFLAGTCERSSTYVSRETDSAFVITCRTCRSHNIWPKDNSDKSAKYQAWMKKMYDLETKDIAARSRPAYSIPGGK
jgi:hypothetical protein